MKYKLYRVDSDGSPFLWGSYSSAEELARATFHLGRLGVKEIVIEVENDTVTCKECDKAKEDMLSDGMYFCYNDGLMHNESHYCKDGKRRKDV